MQSIHKLTGVFKSAANGLKDVTFLKYAFPILAIVGGGVFLYYGYKGIFKKSTINLTKFDGMSFSQSVNVVGEITGISAVITGIFYTITGTFLLILLGGISYYIWF